MSTMSDAVCTTCGKTCSNGKCGCKTMTASRDEIERLMIQYGVDCYAEGKTQKSTDATQASGAALMAAVDSLIADAGRMREALSKARTFIEYARYELEEGMATIGDQFPKQGDADVAMSRIDAALDSASKGGE